MSWAVRTARPSRFLSGFSLILRSLKPLLGFGNILVRLRSSPSVMNGNRPLQSWPLRRKHDDEVMFYAFDILVSDGEDLRKLPLHLRKNNLARLLARRVNGIFLADFEQGEIGPDLFRHACLMGLEGLVSKHKDRPYRAGRSPHWVKVKNREHPAMERVMDTFS